MDYSELKLNKNMLAYCGLYCEQCSFKAAHDENDSKHLAHIPYEFTQCELSEYHCDGCKGDHCLCGKCRIKPCASTKNIENCSECDDFPCDLLDAFSKDGMPHHRGAVENLHEIRERGIDAWYEGIQSSLKCPCGQKQTWYYHCPLYEK